MMVMTVVDGDGGHKKKRENTMWKSGRVLDVTDMETRENERLGFLEIGI